MVPYLYHTYGFSIETRSNSAAVVRFPYLVVRWDRGVPAIHAPAFRSGCPVPATDGNSPLTPSSGCPHRAADAREPIRFVRGGIRLHYFALVKASTSILEPLVSNGKDDAVPTSNASLSAAGIEQKRSAFIVFTAQSMAFLCEGSAERCGLEAV